ncbi:putative FAD-linked oxidoreductase [compost metagenome]
MPGIRIVCFGHVGDGNLHYNQSKPAGMDDAAFLARADAVHDVVHGAAASLGGSISAEHGIGRLKQDAFLQFKPAVSVAVMQRIKQALDPRGTFNPGRLLPRPLRETS